MKRIATLVTAVTAVAAALWLAVPAGAAPTVRPAVSGTRNSQLMTTSATATTIPVIAYGVFAADGMNHTGSKVDTLVFPNGSFKVNHSKVACEDQGQPEDLPAPGQRDWQDHAVQAVPARTRGSAARR